jgi:exodeoxyribonuclease-3
MGAPDPEGRTITMFFGDTVVINSYVPNGTGRLEYKLEYFDKLTDYMTHLAKTYRVILCSDINTAHTESDVSHPKANKDRSGFLPIERERVTTLFSRGFFDAYRMVHPTGQAYSWRSYRSRQIGGNFGWKFRFDYIIVDEKTRPQIQFVEMPDLVFSDHLPVILHSNKIGQFLS